jgi:ParB-like chromosome segregation protein Spo0J
MGYDEFLQQLIESIGSMDTDAKAAAINKAKLALHGVSPWRHEPVDCVLWVKSDSVQANDYNPNQVAPPEMTLLEHSIREDGYTQPIVTWINDGKYEVVDGYHRNRVGKEILDIQFRVKGYLPVTVINTERTGKTDRIASTIRHNRARGKHTIDGMSDIVVELKRRNWSEEKIAKELGMDQDEILRLCQITGLAELFKDTEFSKSWDIEGNVCDETFDPLSDDIESFGDEKNKFRTINTDDDRRIFHKWDKWECYKAGFYNTTKDGMTREQCEIAYRDFLADTQQFSEALNHVITEWKHSCEHYLTNVAFNRIAWLGQASMCYAKGIPSTYRAGFNLLSDKQQQAANEMALIYLNKWLEANGREIVDMESALGSNRQMDLY